MCLVASVCVYVCVCNMWPKNWLFEVLPLENFSLMQSTTCSSSLTAKKELTMMSNSFRERYSINGTGKEFPENCIMVSHSLSTCNAASYAMLLQLQCRPIQYCYRYILYRQCLAYTGYVFCEL